MILRGDAGFAVDVCARMYGEDWMCLNPAGHLHGHVYTVLRRHVRKPVKIEAPRQRVGATEGFFAMMGDRQLSANIIGYRALLRDFPDDVNFAVWAANLEKAVTEQELRGDSNYLRRVRDR